MRTLILALLAAIILCSQAHAESEWRLAHIEHLSFGEFFSHPSTPIRLTDLEHYTNDLNLTQEQRDFIKDRYQAMMITYMERWVDLAERRADSRFMHIPRNDLEYSSWDSVMQERLRRAHTEEQRLMKEITRTITEDLRLILTPEQQDRWSIFERESLRRETLARYAIFDDERYDLIKSVEKLALNDEENEKIAGLLEEYAEALRPLIAIRNARIQAVSSLQDEVADLADRFNRTLQNMTENDADTVAQIFSDYQEQSRTRHRSLMNEALGVRRASERLRDTNIRFRDDLLNLIPEHAHETFMRSLRPIPKRNALDDAHSRAERIISILQNTHEVAATLQSFLLSMPNDDESIHDDASQMQEWLLLLRTTDPITNDQRRQLRRIEDRLQQRREAVLAQHPSLRKHFDDRPNPDITFTIPTNHGGLTLTRTGPAPDPSEREQARMQEIRTQLHKIEQDAVDEIRAILTFHQRMAVAGF